MGERRDPLTDRVVAVVDEREAAAARAAARCSGFGRRRCQLAQITQRSGVMLAPPMSGGFTTVARHPSNVSPLLGVPKSPTDGRLASTRPIPYASLRTPPPIAFCSAGQLTVSVAVAPSARVENVLCWTVAERIRPSLPGVPSLPVAPAGPVSPFGPWGPAAPPGPVARCSPARALLERSFVWIMPSLICLPVINDAATAEPDIATSKATSATAMDPEGVIVRMRFFMRSAWSARKRNPMREPGYLACG